MGNDSYSTTRAFAERMRAELRTDLGVHHDEPFLRMSRLRMQELLNALDGLLDGPSSRLVELLNDVRYRLGAKHLPIEQRLINEAIGLLDATKSGADNE